MFFKFLVFQPVFLFLFTTAFPGDVMHALCWCHRTNWITP